VPVTFRSTTIPSFFVEVLTGFIASTPPADPTTDRIEALLRRGRRSKA
jgi:hypothetical protein